MNSSSKSEDSTKEFRLNDTDEKTILYFIDNANKSTYPAEIARKTKITKKSIGKSCKKLQEQGVLLSELKHGSSGYTFYYSLAELADVLKFIYACGSDDLFIQIIPSKYYRTKIDELVDYSANNLNDSEYRTLKETEKKVLRICLKYSCRLLSAALGIHKYNHLFMSKDSEYTSVIESFREGVLLSLSKVDDVIEQTKNIGEKEKATLKKEIHDQVYSPLTFKLESVFEAFEDNLFSFHLQRRLSLDVMAMGLPQNIEYEEYESDIEKIKTIIDNSMGEFTSFFVEK